MDVLLTLLFTIVTYFIMRKYNIYIILKDMDFADSIAVTTKSPRKWTLKDGPVLQKKMGQKTVMKKNLIRTPSILNLKIMIEEKGIQEASSYTLAKACKTIVVSRRKQCQEAVAHQLHSPAKTSFYHWKVTTYKAELWLFIWKIIFTLKYS